MKQTREIITSNKNLNFHTEEYYTLIAEIEDNIYTHPDISIESCKSIIEGVCKLIMISFDGKTELDLKNKEAPKLFKEAIVVLDKECNKCEEDEDILEILLFETDFTQSFANAINKLCEIRNKRGDICHGRAVPKVVASSSRFARMIKNFTDTHVSYLLEMYFYILANKQEDKLLYEELENFNAFLNESQPEFPITKTSYSEILYKYEYETYENIFRDDFAESSKVDDITGSPIESILTSELIRQFCAIQNLKFEKVLKLVDDHYILKRKISSYDFWDSIIGVPSQAATQSALNEFNDLVNKYTSYE